MPRCRARAWLDGGLRPHLLNRSESVGGSSSIYLTWAEAWSLCAHALLRPRTWSLTGSSRPTCALWPSPSGVVSELSVVLFVHIASWFFPIFTSLTIFNPLPLLAGDMVHDSRCGSSRYILSPLLRALCHASQFTLEFYCVLACVSRTDRESIAQEMPACARPGLGAIASAFPRCSVPVCVCEGVVVRFGTSRRPRPVYVPVTLW